MAVRKKVGDGHAGDGYRILERQEQAQFASLVGGQCENVLTLVNHLTPHHLVAGVTGERISQRAFTGAIRPHERVDFALVDCQCDALQDFCVLHIHAKVADFQCFGHVAGCLLLPDSSQIIA
jgi:hypothetical protein